MGKYKVNGQEYESYHLSNEELVDLIENGGLDEEQKKVLEADLLERFKSNNCRKDGETNDELFARQFGNFVNGKMTSAAKVAEKMAKEHRYLQMEMYRVCVNYFKALAESYEKRNYDPRNEWAVKASHIIVDYLKIENLI